MSKSDQKFRTSLESDSQTEPNSSAAGPPTIKPLTTSEIVAFRDQVVLAFAAAADSVGGSIRRRIMRLANHLAYIEHVDAVLSQPVLLEVFLCLRDVKSPTQHDVDEVVRQTIARLLNRRSTGPPWWSVLLYPLFVLLICGAVTIGVCIVVVPTFEQMFYEFGMRLPLPTMALIELSHWVQNPMFYLAMLCVLICVGVFGWLISGNEFPWSGQPVSQRVSGTMFPSTRQAWADWAFHLSLLFRSGQSDPESLLIAGRASGRRWLRANSQQWAESVRCGEQPFQNVTHFRGEPCHLMALALNSVPLVAESSVARTVVAETSVADTLVAESTISESDTTARSELLNRVAEVYWDDDRSRSQWRLGWLSPLLVIMVGFIVCFVLFSLFLPLVELITGLT